MWLGLIYRMDLSSGLAGSYSSPPLSLAGEWLYVRLSGVRRVCSGTEPQIWAPENDVFDARWTYRTYSTYTWDMWRLKPRSLDWF